MIIALFTWLILSVPGGQPVTKEPFFAVYVSPDLTDYWKGKKVDYYQEAGNWEDFRFFIYQVNERAGGRPVVIDIDVHGDKEGFLYINSDNFYAASEGYLLNQLDRVDNLEIVLQESCYAGTVFKRSLHPKMTVEYSGNVVEDYKGNLPYPIMGVDNVINYNASINDQFRSGYRINYNDLREFTFKDPGEPIPGSNNPKSQSLRWFTTSVRLAERLTKN